MRLQLFEIDKAKHLNAPAKILVDYDTGLCFMDQNEPFYMDRSTGYWLVQASAVQALGYKLFPMSSLTAIPVFGEMDINNMRPAVDFLFPLPLLCVSFDPVSVKRETPVTYTYFIFNERSKAIKIGKSQNVQQRFSAIAASVPDPLELLHSHPEDIERKLHKKLAKHRLNGEWFTDCEEVRNEIARLQNQ